MQVGAPLGEPFLYTHRSGVYFNSRAPSQPTDGVEGAQTHLPCAYALLRRLLPQEDAAALWEQTISRPAEPTAVPTVRTFNKSHEAFGRRYPALVAGVLALKEAFGRSLSLPEDELDRVGITDIRCVRYGEGAECPWHRDDPRAHFVVVVLLSDPHLDFEGGRMVVHPGECADDADAMPLDLEQGDALIYAAPRLDTAMQRVSEGDRVACVFELGLPRAQAWE